MPCGFRTLFSWFPLSNIIGEPYILQIGEGPSAQCISGFMGLDVPLPIVVDLFNIFDHWSLTDLPCHHIHLLQIQLNFLMLSHFLHAILRESFLFPPQSKWRWNSSIKNFLSVFSLIFLSFWEINWGLLTYS